MNVWGESGCEVLHIAVTGLTLSKDCVLVNQTSVMLVDGLTETEEVLKGVLEPRGTQVTRVRSTRSTFSTASQGVPSVVVVHESERSTGLTFRQRTVSAPWDDVPRVVIGQTHANSSSAKQGCRYLTQPFEYAELVTAIESLLPTS